MKSQRSSTPTAQLLVLPFPEPGRMLSVSMEELQYYALNPPEDEDDVRAMAALPRPWDPATCDGRLRGELWAWLDHVARWINEQHLWGVGVGLPECWPAHPHVIHDLAVVACARYYTAFALAPTALDDWHRYSLPSFLERLSSRLDGGCQPGRHTDPPRGERDRHAQAPAAIAFRRRFMLDDVEVGG